MSGLEPLVALGLACNILQIIGVGRETVRCVKQVYQSGELDSSLGDYAATLKTISSAIRSPDPTFGTGSGNKPPKDRRLFTAAQKCSDAARDLQEEVSFLQTNAQQGNLVAALKTTVKTVWRKKRLERLENKLREAEQSMQTDLLVYVVERMETTHTALETTDKHLKDFFDAYRCGHRDVSNLISVENLMIRSHISSISVASEARVREEIIQQTGSSERRLGNIVRQTAQHSSKQISQAVAQLKLDTVTDASRDRLLKSLKYGGMNERRSMAREAHSHTFEWAFTGSDAESVKQLANKHINTAWDSFDDWLKSNETIYWVSGKPGSGKTTLMKYLINEKHTAESLSIWNPDTLVLCHYFWRPGTAMQKSIKGFLSSLLHQLLENSQSLISSVFSRTSKIRQKDSETDWSIHELQSVMQHVLEEDDRPLCIFIDALDELFPDSQAIELLRLIDVWEIARPDNIKFCISSRPEYPIQKRLTSRPHLRLQDLTFNDLREYAMSELRSSAPPDRCTNELVSLMIEKADGVFLWLYLVVKDVTKGLEKDDDESELYRRIKRLPSDIYELYRDMWLRLNGDEEIYRQQAARYFRLLKHGHLIYSDFYSFLNLLDVVLCTNPDVVDAILDGIADDKPSVPCQLLEALCREAAQRVAVKCGGLVEVDTNGRRNEEVFSWYGDKYNGALRFVDERVVVRFMHRTALDFLDDTPEGRALVAHDTISHHDLLYQMIRATLATSQLFEVDANFLLVKFGVKILHHLSTNISEKQTILKQHHGVMSIAMRFAAKQKLWCGRGFKFPAHYQNEGETIAILCGLGCPPGWPLYFVHVLNIRPLPAVAMSQVLLEVLQIDADSRNVQKDPDAEEIYEDTEIVPTHRDTEILYLTRGLVQRGLDLKVRSGTSLAFNMGPSFRGFSSFYSPLHTPLTQLLLLQPLRQFERVFRKEASPDMLLDLWDILYEVALGSDVSQPACAGVSLKNGFSERSLGNRSCFGLNPVDEWEMALVVFRASSLIELFAYCTELWFPEVYARSKAPSARTYTVARTHGRFTCKVLGISKAAVSHMAARVKRLPTADCETISRTFVKALLAWYQSATGTPDETVFRDFVAQCKDVSGKTGGPTVDLVDLLVRWGFLWKIEQKSDSAPWDLPLPEEDVLAGEEDGNFITLDGMLTHRPE